MEKGGVGSGKGIGISIGTKLGLVLLAVVLYALHQDFWNWTNKTLVFGFLPVSLAYHAVYSICCAGMMWAMVKFAWPSDLENIEPVQSTENH